MGGFFGGVPVFSVLHRPHRVACPYQCRARPLAKWVWDRQFGGGYFSALRAAACVQYFATAALGPNGWHPPPVQEKHLRVYSRNSSPQHVRAVHEAFESCGCCCCWYWRVLLPPLLLLVVVGRGQLLGSCRCCCCRHRCCCLNAAPTPCFAVAGIRSQFGSKVSTSTPSKPPRPPPPTAVGRAAAAAAAGLGMAGGKRGRGAAYGSGSDDDNVSPSNLMKRKHARA